MKYDVAWISMSVFGGLRGLQSRSLWLSIFLEVAESVSTIYESVSTIYVTISAASSVVLSITRSLFSIP